MKKRSRKSVLWLMILSMVLVNVFSPVIPVLAEQAQEEILIYEGFDGLAKDPKEVPEGWTLKTTDFYKTKTGESRNGPSLKIAKTQVDAVITPTFNSKKDMEVSFWVASNLSTPGNPNYSKLKIEGLKEGNWEIVKMLEEIKVGGEFIEIDLPKEFNQLKFSYEKNGGNIALDDIKVVTRGKIEVIELEDILVQKEMNMEIEDENILGLEFKPSNTTQTNVSWESSDNSVVTINKGKIKALKQGESIITVSSLDNPKIKSQTKVIVKARTDKNGPEVSNKMPIGSTKENNRPEISAKFQDESGINKDTVKIALNDEDITSKCDITEEGFKFTPKENLKDGAHNVKVILADIVGNNTEISWTFSVGIESKELYFGQLHSHTNLSDGIGTIDEAYEYGKNKANVDFLAVTDHSNWFDNDTAANINDGSMSEKWKQGRVAAAKYKDEGKFVSLYGYEMTWSKSTGGWGHINTFNSKGFETRSNSKMDLKTYYDTISKAEETISQLNHPGKTFGDFGDFGFYSSAADNVVNMIEVGNGEGPIRGSGYFPSFEYYTRALDKGWHVAPTNNQDNHKGRWGNANSARTVIEAPALTEEAIYQSLRERKVYATEDENLKINLTVNDEPMGTIFKDAEKLNFKINVMDEDKEDKISKISIIANGGAVVESKKFDSSSADWNVELKPEYSYYYIRVDQSDKDIAVTAPVWVGETVSVGLTSIVADSKLSALGEEVELTTKVFNNSEKDLEGVRIEYFAEQDNNKEKIHEDTLKLKASTNDDVKIKWIPKSTGEFIISAKATIKIDDVNKNFVVSTKHIVKKSEDIARVVVDGSKENEYINGKYKDQIRNFKELIESNEGTCVVNKNELTEDVLKDSKLLVITNPQSVEVKDKVTGEIILSPKKYSEKEIQVIANFVENGGNIIIASKADYGDGQGEYSNDKQLNPILQAINSNLRINDDQVIDNDKYSNQTFRLAFDMFADSKYGITSGLGKDQTYSFYSGCSVVAKEGADLSKVEFLVSGHDTTLTQDADKQGDNVPVEKGNVKVLAAEELANGSKVMVSGSSFFTDFEIENIENANRKITENALRWLAPKKIAEKISIKEFRNIAEKQKGERYTIEGTVTSQSEGVNPKNSFFEVIYVQDETAGITVFGISKTPLKVGQKVRITGVTGSYEEDLQLALDGNEDENLEIIDANESPIEPKVMSTKDSMLKETEGLLIKTSGKVERITADSIYINDGSGTARVHLQGYIWDGKDEATKGKWDVTIKVGDSISAIGLASVDPEGNRIRVRNSGEILKIKDGDIVDPVEPLDPVDPVDPNKPEIPVEPVDPSKPEIPVKPLNPVDIKDTTSSREKPMWNKIPKTGGVTLEMLLTLGITLTLGGVLIIKKKK